MTLPVSYSLEDAISETKFGKFNCILIFLCGLILGCAFVETGCITLVLPIAQCELQMTNFHKGFLGSIGFIGIILSSHFWGFLADTKGRKNTMIVALLLAAFFSICSTLAKTFWVIALFRFLNGFCICGPQITSYAFLGEFHTIKYRARVLLIASIIYALIGTVNPINAILFLNQETWNFYIPFLDLNYSAWRIFLLFCSVPSIISAIILITLIPESPKFTYSQGDEAKTLAILQRVYKFNTGKSLNEFKVKNLAKDKEFEAGQSENSKGFFEFMWSQTAPLFQKPHLKNTLTACYLQLGLCVSANSYFTFYPEILNRVYLWLESDPTHITATVCQIYSSFHSNSTVIDEIPEICITRLEVNVFLNIIMLMFMYAFGWFIMSLIINKTGKLVILVFISFASGMASLSMMFIELPKIATSIYLMVMLASLNMSVINSSTVELFPTNLRAMAVSISMMFGRVGSVAGSNFLGLTIQNFCTYTWILPGVLMITSGFLVFTIPNINKRAKK
ncbi:hypothetical protein PVAND_012396 [Polypedilum vanderplanki]|uniref:Major facilitator superfamily (MFS) profile domain-containing protein n=1 Tax=Polypedilum vanderplanki TaxID=319348 RepID=A0A9J6CMA4_POLVA|nr:hypothetical protein PVAND_012396 [Polypedilum vanderplanki]